MGGMGAVTSLAGARPVAWVARPAPLAPRALAARGEAARALARRLLAWEEARRRGVTGCAGDGVLVVLGEDLPWVDGGRYLGHDPAAPRLLVPTSRAPDVPLDLFAEALAARLPRVGGPWAVFPGGDGGLTVISLAAAGVLDRAAL